MLGTETEFSARETNGLNHWAFSPAPSISTLWVTLLLQVLKIRNYVTEDDLKVAQWFGGKLSFMTLLNSL